MKTLILVMAVVGTAICLLSCNSAKGTEKVAQSNEPVVIGIGNRTGETPLTGMSFIPRAKVYRTNADYNNNVPVQVSSDGKSLISFPDPSDINSGSLPIVLSGGWLLDRRGVSDNTRFTSYTYAEYERLKMPPSVAELLQSIIPSAQITEMVELPMTTPEAVADTALVNKIINTGFQGCRFVIEAPATNP